MVKVYSSMKRIKLNNKRIKLNNKRINTLYILAMLCLIIIFLLRFLKLDIDLPSYGISYYMPIDEGLYSKMSLSLYNLGSLYSYKGMELYIAPNYRANFLGNILQYFFLWILGDNYTAFRISYTIFGSLTVLFTMLSGKLILEKYEVTESHKKISYILLMTFFTFDFSFLMACRVVENSIIRMLFVAIIIYIFLKCQNIFKRSFLMTFFAVCSIFFVYFTNVFVLAPIGILFIYYFCQKDYKRMKSHFIGGFLGGILALILAEIYYILVWKSFAIENLLKALTDFSGRLSWSDKGSAISVSTSDNLLIKWFENSTYFSGSNIFFFNCLLFVSVFILIIISVIYIKKEKNELLIVLLSLVIMYFIQAILITDGMERKGIVCLPICLILLVFWVANISVIKTMILNIRNQENKKKFFKYFLPFIFILLYYAFSCYSVKKYRNFYTAMSSNTLLLFKIIIPIQIITLILVGIYLLWNPKLKKEVLVVFGSCFLVIFLLLNGLFSCHYVYFSEYRTEKKLMISLGNDLKPGEPVLWSYAYGYTLYNDIAPISASIEQYREYIQRDDVKYFLHYSSIDNSDYLNEEIFGEKNATVRLYKTYEDRHYKSIIESDAIGIFKKVEK